MCKSCGLPVAAGEAFCGNCGQSAAQTVTLAGMPEAGSNGGRWPAGPGDQAVDDAALGQATPNAHYLGLRLAYDKVPEGSFDPIGNRRLVGQFAMHFVLYCFVYGGLAIASGVVLAILALAGLGARPAITLWAIGAAIVGLLFLCLYWLIPVPAQLSEWKFFVDGKAAVAPVTFDHIAWVLQQRQTPLDKLRVRRLKLAGGESRDYLEIRRGLFSGLVSCFAYGEDLYVGWTFWVRVSPARCALMFIARLWQTLMRRGTDMYVSLRYDYARAMREAMHSSAREGVDVAVGQASPHGQGMGQSMQVAVSNVDV